MKSEYDCDDASGPQLTTLSNVEPTEVQWLWKNRIPLGMLSIIAGDPNSGKSTLLVDMAARISSGSSWPDSDDENPVGDVILLPAEDGISDTVRVRLDNSGGNPSRVHVLDGIRRDDSDFVEPFRIDRDIRHLETILGKNPNIRLIGFDPLDVYLGAETDSNKKSDIQRVLSKLTRLADTYKVAIVGILHNRKSIGGDKALYRILGSLGFVSAPRAVWSITRDSQDKIKRLFCCVKCNIAPDPTGLSFKIIDAGVIDWDNTPLLMTADEAAEQEKPRTPSAIDEAIDFLHETLAIGPMEANRIFELAGVENIAKRTLDRAKREIGIQSKQKTDGDKTAWYWELPPGCQSTV